ncbi:hypothetical protein [Acinetobacter proteolyticus]|uniref:Uncharacterized protein n=1 Tax=Acinetobacter proteolyticus TaxID=1776741 RepID=A0A2N0WI62_9GAMM|nr:hypothetical protein [Acinetobacter proteolyticus]PKF35490.1 hypothetical protein CW311_04160 [Acinetobacter proteolyticus]
MAGCILVVFKEAETELHALLDADKRLERFSSKLYDDIGEAYENMKIAQAEGKIAIILDNDLVQDLAKGL